jgi:hypothetical protein
MSDTFNYSLVATEEGAFAVRSTVKSFNLDHVTDKDIVSFYKSFSQYASFDTGLMPLDGTGVLAIRTAGPHTQVVTQHKPGIYHINWGSHEGDSNAKAYYVAQPYRIVIGDFKNGQLLGAKMFYSPLPITSPDNQLYHVNLPNINCKGYRGNAVGWICLYHKDDWSSLPFNEKISRFIERCSGVETYNDANMSETDGPRFYASHNKPSYFWDPAQWENKSGTDGYQWTLDDTLLIPVKVKDMDNQSQHDDNGIPLTLAMAMLGNYQAYYSDGEHTKMYNKVSRSDVDLNNKDIANFVKASFASASVTHVHQSKDNPYDFTIAHREQNGSATLDTSMLWTSSDQDENNDENSWVCSNCEELISDEDPANDVDDNDICGYCVENHYVYIKSVGKYFHQESSNLVYVESTDSWYHAIHDTIIECKHCSTAYGESGDGILQLKTLEAKFHKLQDSSITCQSCFISHIENNDLESGECLSCKKTIVTSTGWESIYPQVKTVSIDVLNPDNSHYEYVSFCDSCAPNFFVCPCGLIKDKSETQFGSCTPTPIASYSDSVALSVTSCCGTCLGNVTEDQSGMMVANFDPTVPAFVQIVAKHKIYHNIDSIHVQPLGDDPF